MWLLRSGSRAPPSRRVPGRGSSSGQIFEPRFYRRNERSSSKTVLFLRFASTFHNGARRGICSPIALFHSLTRPGVFFPCGVLLLCGSLHSTFREITTLVHTWCAAYEYEWCIIISSSKSKTRRFVFRPLRTTQSVKPNQIFFGTIYDTMDGRKPNLSSCVIDQKYFPLSVIPDIMTCSIGSTFRFPRVQISEKLRLIYLLSLGQSNARNRFSVSLFGKNAYVLGNC